MTQWRNNGNRIRLAGVFSRCEECPCGSGEECSLCEPPDAVPEEISVTISGVTGCSGTCADRNGTIVLIREGACSWGGGVVTVNGFWNVQVSLTADGIQVVINDEFTDSDPTQTYAIFTGTRSGRCDELSTTAPDTFYYEYIGPSLCGATAWCDWTAATFAIEAL